MMECASISPKIVKKVWGEEIWLINESEYCFKILNLNKGSAGSLHYHPKKKETFIVIGGKVKIEYDNKVYKLKAGTKPLTIYPNTPHRFTGLKESRILEISTHHDDADVVRIEESRK